MLLPFKIPKNFLNAARFSEQGNEWIGFSIFWFSLLLFFSTFLLQTLQYDTQVWVYSMHYVWIRKKSKNAFCIFWKKKFIKHLEEESPCQKNKNNKNLEDERKHARNLLTLTTLSLECGEKTLFMAENQLPFFPMFLAFLFVPEMEINQTIKGFKAACKLQFHSGNMFPGWKLYKMQTTSEAFSPLLTCQIDGFLDSKNHLTRAV